MIRYRIVCCLFVLILFPALALAQVSGGTSVRSELLVQLATLLNEVARLQTLLQQQLSTTAYGHRGVQIGITETTQYQVTERGLVPFIGERVPQEHQYIYALFLSTLGQEVVRSRVTQFGVGTVNNDFYDTYVEGHISYLPHTDSWRFLLKRSATAIPDTLEIELLQDLFIHEYGHILAFERPLLLEDFSNRFWNRNNYDMSESVQAIFDRKGFPALDEIHEGNEHEFVSGYAMLDAEEDFSETLVAFVKSGRPTGNSLREQKILYFWSDAHLREWRMNIRERINR